MASLIGIYNYSHTSAGLPWNTYNYCNAPHVNELHYPEQTYESKARLAQVTVFMRHHKRTPDNLYPDESQFNPTGWDCSNIETMSYSGHTTPVRVETSHDSSHPFAQLIWNGTCDAGQLTAKGLQDAIEHGKDFWGVYHDKLHLLHIVDPAQIHIRTSNEPRTHQVAGGLLHGMSPAVSFKDWKVSVQPSNIDSLVPNYPCPKANDIRSSLQSLPAWTEHLERNKPLADRLGSVVGTKGDSGWDSWYDHYFDSLSTRLCHGKPLPCNPKTGQCVTKEDAESVFSLGDWEYDYIWNTPKGESEYTRLTFGVMFGELASNLRAFKQGSDPYLARLIVGHDGSMIRLASGLGFGKERPLRWPAMGSEIVIEVWKSNKFYVRVLHEGTLVSGFEWLALDEMLVKLDKLASKDLYSECGGVSH